MMPTLRSLLKPVVEEGRTLTRQEAGAVLEEILAAPLSSAPEAPASHIHIAALLTAMAVRGETAAELAGFADAMRAAATPLPLEPDERAQVVDTCGTGGDGLGTFNISTGAALVAAAAGAKVAKHGNRAVTSKCGSADVLEALGVPVDLEPEQAVDCLRATGFMFLLATALHPAMRQVAPVRRALGFRTIFNLAGPLTNPAGAQAQVMGVWAESKMDVVAEAMGLLGVRHAFVVHGEVCVRRGSAPAAAGAAGAAGAPGMDELTVTGASHIAEVRRAGPASTEWPDLPARPATVRRFTIHPEELGLAGAPLSSLGGGETAEQSAAVLLAIFEGEDRGPRREIVLLNAAAALVAAGLAADLRKGIEQAVDAIDSGRTLDVLARLHAFGRTRT